MEQQVRSLSIVNMVVTADLKQAIDLKRLVNVRGFRYNPSVYQCAYFKDAETRGKVSIFGTGKMISVAATRIEDAEHDLGHAKSVLAELGLIEDVEIKVQLQNTVVTADLGHPFDIAKFATRPEVVYEPEQFPGAIYYPGELDGACILIFASGKVVISGIKTAEFLDSCGNVLRKLIRLESE